MAIYHGEQVVKSDQLREYDPTKALTLPTGNKLPAALYRLRDEQKELLSVMTDGRVIYSLFGVELQSDVDYGMPVRGDLYDVLDYAAEVGNIARRHREDRKKKSPEDGDSQAEQKKPSSGEFLSGFWKEDRLRPCITITVYLGADKWDGPTSLSEMVDFPDEYVRAAFNDYRLILIQPATLSKAEICTCQSSLQEVFLALKYSTDKDELAKILNEFKTQFGSLERSAADVINTLTGMHLKYSKGTRKVDMCQAIQDMIDERAQEMSRQIAQEISQEMCQRIVQNLYHNHGLDVASIALDVGQDVATIEQWLGLNATQA